MTSSVYMVISHIQRPAAGLNMNKRGVAGNPDNWETFENMALVDRVKKAQLQQASVIIDLLNGKVLKNRFETSDTQTFAEYVDRYQEDVTEALKLWGSRDPANYKKLKALSEAAHAVQEAKKEADDTTDSN